MATVLPPPRPFNDAISGHQSHEYPRCVSPAAISPSTSLNRSESVEAAVDRLQCWNYHISLNAAEGLYSGETTTYSKIVVNPDSYLSCGKVFKYFAEQFPNLSELHLLTQRGLNNIKDEDLLCLTQRKSHAMRKATLNNCPRLTSEALETFLLSCKGLTEFSTNLSCFGDTHVDALITNRAIKVLTIGGRNEMSSGALLNIAQSVLPLTKVSVLVDTKNEVYQDEIEAAERLFKSKNVLYSIAFI